ncbi:hypothetical protein AcV7_004222 [Taiwanofungus camphoratus]|nr:hypothetical protein AcV7_004222 [Antrodia cinnamomea]
MDLSKFRLRHHSRVMRMHRHHREYLYNIAKLDRNLYSPIDDTFASCTGSTSSSASLSSQTFQLAADPMSCSSFAQQAANTNCDMLLFEWLFDGNAEYNMSSATSECRRSMKS